MNSLLNPNENLLGGGGILSSTRGQADIDAIKQSKSFDPTKIANLKAWYDASKPETIVSSGGLVAEWKDGSGNGNHLTQSIGARQPTTGSSSLNGLNVVTFDGSSDRMEIPSGLFSIPNGDNTVLCVLVAATVSTTQAILAMTDGGSARYRVVVNTATGKTEAQNNTASMVGLAVNDYQLSVNTPFIQGLVRDGASITTINAGKYGGVPSSASSFSATTASLGCFPTGIQFFNGIIAELVFFDRALTNIELDLMGQYLSRKWGASWNRAGVLSRWLQGRESVVGFGDSITVGTAGVSGVYNSWLNILGATTGAVVTNKGLSGTVLQNSNDAEGAPRSGNGRDRYVADLTGAAKKDVVAIMYGYNDLRYTGGGDMSLANFVNDYQEIITGLLSSSYAASDIVLISPPWGADALYISGSAGFTGSNRTIHEEYVAAVRALAVANGTLYADAYSHMRDNGGEKLIYSDNIHPNNEGHEVIYDAVINAKFVF